VKNYVYECSCVDVPAEDVEALTKMIEEAEEVSYDNFVRHCDGIVEWAARMGYTREKRQGLTLKHDWHVSFHRSKYKGVDCLFLRHSSIEYIWVWRDPREKKASSEGKEDPYEGA